jgi:GAF domain-containing protein
MRLGGETLSQVARTGKPLIIPMLHKDGVDPAQEPGYQSYLDHFDVDSLLILPMLAQGQVIGTLGVLRDHPGDAYTLEDLSLLRYIANQASHPILNARLHQQLMRQAHTDALTGIPNRRYFFDLAEVEFLTAEEHGYNLAVMMLDVDHFKEINDAYGHNVGDQMLSLAVCRRE